MNADTIMFHTICAIFALIFLVGACMWLAHCAAVRKAAHDPLTPLYVMAIERHDPLTIARLRKLLVAKYGSLVTEQASARVRRTLGQVQ